MLDAPIRVGGGLAGVLCHEHVGDARRFHDDELHTATYLANLVAAAMEFRDRLESEARARQALSRADAKLYEAKQAGRNCVAA